MNRKIFFIISILILTFSYCIRDNTLEPELNPGRRDYTWTVDTINSFNPVYRIWGSSPNDVWAISTGSVTQDIFHYNGSEWLPDGILIFSPYSIWGFSESNVYIGSEGGRIFHYDGNNWKQMVSLTKDGRSDIAFDNMWGETPTNIYATGAYPDDRGYANNSVIAHYDGSWTILNTDGLIGIVERFYRNISDNKSYIRTNRYGGGNFPDSTLIYEYYQKKYTKLYSSVWARGLQSDLSIISKEVYFIFGNRIAKRNNNHFETFLQLDNYNFYHRIWGKNSKNIFLSMTDGLAHYNGDNIEYLFYFNNPRTQIFRAAIFDEEVFFLVYESPTGLSLIYHGKLN